MAAPLQYLLITVKVVALEKVSFSDTENPQAVCYQIESRLEGLSAYWRQFNANNSDAIMSKTKKFFSIFFVLLKYVLNFKHLPRKHNPHSLCISRGTGSEKYG